MKISKCQHCALWVFLLLTIAAIDFSLCSTVLRQKTEVLTRAQETLSDAVELVKLRVENSLEIYSHTLSGIAEVVAARGGLSQKPDFALHQLLVRRLVITPGLRALFVVHPNGTVAEFTRSYPAFPYALADRDYVRSQIESSESGLFIGAKVQSRSDKLDFFPVRETLIYSFPHGD